MNTYKVTYTGNSTYYNGFENLLNSKSEREAVELTFSKVMPQNYFPQDDGSVKDCDGHTIAEDANDAYFEYDGGYFSAELINE